MYVTILITMETPETKTIVQRYDYLIQIEKNIEKKIYIKKALYFVLSLSLPLLLI